MSLITLPAFPLLKPCILSWHLLRFLLMPSLPYHSLALHPGSLNFVLLCICPSFVSGVMPGKISLLALHVAVSLSVYISLFSCSSNYT